MIDQARFVYADALGDDLYTRSQTRDRVLNAAIVKADISRSFEEYLEIFDAFYADDVEVIDEAREESIRGKARVGALLFNFLVPLHVMAEVGGLSVFIRQTPIPGDVAGETTSAWTIDFVAASGATCTLSWCTLRRWNRAKVAFECHYNYEQKGGPLTLNDFNSARSRPQRGDCPHNGAVLEFL